MKMKELERAQRALERRFSTGLDLREKAIRIELENILNQKELFWLQKSRNNWLANGDKNTSFFHRRTLRIMRQNRIGALIVDRSS